ncbi:MAG: maleylacetoacetate isomerase [Pseudomonadota bacterium]
MELYTYFRSTASYRVRIVLNFKGLDYQSKPIHLLKGGGEQFKENYRQINPMELVPTLIHDEKIITQSLAIIEYLEECFNKPAILPADIYKRAFVRSIAQAVCCDIHPLNNLRVLTYLKQVLDVSPESKKLWYANWITKGFTAIEIMVKDSISAKYCCGDSATLADVCLIPQVFNAIRFNVSLKPFPRIRQIYEHCMTLPYFDEAKPESQLDAM